MNYRYKLQTKTPDGWKYVFSHNSHTGEIVTTNDRKKAIPHSAHSRQYFSHTHPAATFRGDHQAEEAQR